MSETNSKTDATQINESQINESQINESQINESQINESQVNGNQVNESPINQIDQGQIDQGQTETRTGAGLLSALASLAPSTASNGSGATDDCTGGMDPADDAGAELPPHARPLASWLTKHRITFKTPFKNGKGVWIFNLERCPFDESHGGTSVCTGVMPNGAMFFKCHHNSCAGRKWKELKAHFGDVTATPPKPEVPAYTPDQLKADLDLAKAIVERTATDPGAPLETDAVALLIRLALNARPDFVRALTQLKAAGAPMREIARAIKEARKDAQTTGEASFASTSAGLIWNKPGPEGVAQVQLTNFTARIVSDESEDDGVEVKRVFGLEAELEDETYRFQVGSEKFDAMHWPTEKLGAEAVVFPGLGVRDAARAAIQILSDDPMKTTVYSHLGWRQLEDGSWGYISAGGVLTATASPSAAVRLPQPLMGFRLPTPVQGEELVACVKSSLKVLAVAPRRVTIPLFAAVFRAVLGALDFALHLVGPSGVFKSELAALVQMFWGASLNARRLPGSWHSTANANEGLLFAAKDAICVIDDFAPNGTASDRARYHRDADRLVRALGNGAGRGRMNADGSLRLPKPPRGLMLSTGEDTPEGHSIRARLGVLELSMGDVDLAQLTACQKEATAGTYSRVLAAYITWLAPRYDALQGRLRADLDTLRAEAAQDSLLHRRTPELVANLAKGLATFIDFASFVGALSEIEAQELWGAGWAALGETAAHQAEHQIDAEPATRFLALAAAMVAAGRAHLAAPSGIPPHNASRWGWRLLPHLGEWQPGGNLIGWLTEKDEVLLEPQAAYSAVQSFARDGEGLSVGLLTLKKRLHEKGLLASTETRCGKRHLMIRRKIHDERRYVLHVKWPVVDEDESEVLSDEALEHPFGVAPGGCPEDNPQGNVGDEVASPKSEPKSASEPSGQPGQPLDGEDPDRQELLFEPAPDESNVGAETNGAQKRWSH